MPRFCSPPGSRLRLIRRIFWAATSIQRAWRIFLHRRFYSKKTGFLNSLMEDVDPALLYKQHLLAEALNQFENYWFVCCVCLCV
jgi:hypothetical protein